MVWDRTSQKLVVAGIVSWGRNCSDPTNSDPGIYTNVSKYSKWIDNVLKRYG